MKGRNLPIGTGPFNIWIYVRGLIRAYVLSLILFMVSGLLITYTNIGENIYPVFTSVVLIASIAYAAIYVAVKLGARGWLHGAAMGLIYITILVLLSRLFIDGYIIDRYVLYRYAISLVTGAIGGMIGINIK
jgi:putative membrane protein (TIGR04086 family)